MLKTPEILAERLGINCRVTIPIKSVYNAYTKTLSGIFAGLPFDVTEEKPAGKDKG